MAEEKDVEVVIVGAGPAGLAISACLNRISISNILLEREDCFASLWKKRSYDRLKLHLAKNYCELPHMSFPPNTPTFPSKACFLKYLEDYVFYFGIKPYYRRCVESASYDGDRGRWSLTVRNGLSNDVEVYVGRFLVVATGENGEGNVPYVPGLDRFSGLTMHSSEYKNGRMFESKNALVVGCGNSGMEIAYDLSNSGASTSIVVRSPVHLLDKEIVRLGMFLLRFLPCKVVDAISVKLFELKNGDVSKYGLKRPKNGPFLLKTITGRSPTIDVGCVKKIKKGDIKVMPSIASINGEKVEFYDGKSDCFDVIVFATGYKSSVRSWLKGGEEVFNENGMPKRSWPDHWKGENGLYCVGFGSKGLMGISADAQNVAKHIASELTTGPATHSRPPPQPQF